jgi:pyruvate/2-oxoglutarate dehydrogenase complex dihydrolipoamide dehydrogenase (E3) component
MAKFDFDVAVIGGGSGGYAAARTAAAAGRKTVVIEGGEEVGGLCILRGCMPTKALLYAAEVKHLAEQAPTWGIHPGKVRLDLPQAMARKDAQIKDFADYRARQLSDGRFKFMRANAHFLDPHTLALSDGKPLTANSIVIATGSRIAPPPLPQLNEVGFITSDEAIQLKRLPKSLIVLGGGAIAVEFAQLFARFGVPVTVIQRSEHLLKEFDVDAAEELAKAFQHEKIRVLTGTKLVDVRRRGRLKIVFFDQNGRRQAVSAHEILFALGRVPNTDTLALAAAGIKTDGGRIITDDLMRTNVPHIYAVGDCTGPHEIVHVAIQQGETAAHNLGQPRTPRAMDYRLLISVVFTDPQVAVVGLTERQAKAQAIPYLAASYPFNDHGKSLIMDAKFGFVKLLADPGTGAILGGSCVGPVGGELIHEIVTAIAGRLTVHALAATPHYHPTLAEIWTYPAEELADQIRLPGRS